MWYERRFCLIVIPAKAGMYDINHWIPAFAGMTVGVIGAL